MTEPAPPLPARPPRKDLLGRALGLFADVRAGEGPTVLLLAANVFLLLTAYYILKIVREPLILAGGGAEVKSYAAAGQGALLIVVARVYGALAQRVGRMQLITAVTLFFASNLGVFWLLARLHVPLGVAFYLWVGVFNLTVIAQFWSFTNDLYDPDQGKRLLAVVGIGSSLGAVFGARLAKLLFRPLGPYALMPVAAGILVVCLGVTWLVDRRERRRAEARGRVAEEPIGREGAFALVARDRYLLLVAALTLLLNWVNTTGEYVLDRTLLEAAARGTGALTREEFIGTFKAEYFSRVNLVGVLLQLFVVSRVMKYLGVRRALFALPLAALMGYSTIAFLPVLSLVMAAKVAENSIDYSLQNTARQALFLVTTREAKYKAKAVIDAFVWRAGDVLSAVVVWLGVRNHFATRHFVWVNLALVGLWLAVVVALGRRHRALEAAAAHEPG